ncbi:MAG: hypothetical protein JW395_0562 [Nitrospira sp.]|nr:hypothetical protein [Nitrospira sp.]
MGIRNTLRRWLVPEMEKASCGNDMPLQAARQMLADSNEVVSVVKIDNGYIIRFAHNNTRLGQTCKMVYAEKEEDIGKVIIAQQVQARLNIAPQYELPLEDKAKNIVAAGVASPNFSRYVTATDFQHQRNNLRKTLYEACAQTGMSQEKIDEVLRNY